MIEHCLYGVDINPMAVEMAKLSLWLVSMDPRRPFTFLDDRLIAGDSLLGITSIEQVEWMHLDPREGRILHEGAVLDFMAGVRSLLSEVAAERVGLVSISGDDMDAVSKKREILAGVEVKTGELSRYADLIAGAGLASSLKRGWARDSSLREEMEHQDQRRRLNLWLIAAKVAHDAATLGAAQEAEKQARDWLATDQPDGALDRDPLHWPLVFPEVFDPARPDGPGFNAVIGNPPFLGGPKLRPALGFAYREFLSESVANNVRGTNTDLVAYFVLRAHALLNRSGQAGLIATNTVAQGDTREVGLDQLVASGVEIRRAAKSKPWPSRSAVLRYSALWTSMASGAENTERIVDGVFAKRITSSLEAASRASGTPERLAANKDLAYLGHHVNGMGFIMTDEEAADLREHDGHSAEVVQRYLVGHDLNNRPDCSASRWIINFQDWDLPKAERYTGAIDRVRALVKPERANRNRESHRKYWWRYADYRRGLEAAITGLDRVIVVTRVSKSVMPVLVPTGQIMGDATVVFATSDNGMLALLSSALHYWWAINRASTMKGDLRYAPSDVFETLPRPEITAAMRESGQRLDTFRRELMLARQAGLTATYNLVHSEGCKDTDVAELRSIHRAIDEAVVRAYGWDDLLVGGLDHGFHETRQGPRYTIGSLARQEILDRLLELNHERYAEEQRAGLHDRGTRKRAIQDAEGDTLF